MENSSFKTCPCCGKGFSASDIMQRPEIKVKGMTFDQGNLDTSLFYFDHVCVHCGTTFVIPVMKFQPYIKESIPELLNAGSETCERHCQVLTDHDLCEQNCKNAPFRRFMKQMIEQKKLNTGQPQDCITTADG